MARALSQILTELNSTYQPQKDLYNTQLNTLDPQMNAEEKGLQAQQQDSFGQITAGANRRGLLFSGIPLAEQAQYTGSSFLPAVANLKAKYAQQRFNLQDALAKISQDQYKTAYDIYGNEVQQDEAAKARAAAGAGGGGFNLGGNDATPTGGYGMQRRKDGGFNFVDAYGNPVSAATYSAATKVPFRSLLQQMANQGDKGAQSVLGFVGNDYRYDSNKWNVLSPQTQGLYNALTWGTNVNNPGTSKTRGSAVSGRGGGGGGGY